MNIGTSRPKHQGLIPGLAASANQGRTCKPSLAESQIRCAVRPRLYLSGAKRVWRSVQASVADAHPPSDVPTILSLPKRSCSMRVKPPTSCYRPHHQPTKANTED